jgi:hypothetical protein
VVRKVAKDKKSGVPKKYLTGTSGAKRSELSRLIKRIAKLAKDGKTIPRSLIKRRVELGSKKKKSPSKKKKSPVKKRKAYKKKKSPGKKKKSTKRRY